MHRHTRELIDLALEYRALRFGRFTLKSGRSSPYFFNAGALNDGMALRRLCGCYRDALSAAGVEFDMLFGPAYKGIPLATGLALTYAESGDRALPWAFDRKEAKDHGEGGDIIGAPLRGRVVIVDDVLSAGTSIRHSLDLVRAHGAQPVAAVVALDREERGQGESGARSELEAAGLSVISISGMADLVEFLDEEPDMHEHYANMVEYRAMWGIDVDE